MIDATPTGITRDLLLATLLTGVIGFAIIARRIPLRLSIPVTSFKVALPTAYFAWFYTGQWYIIDDITYAEQSASLLAVDYTIVSILLNIDVLRTIAGGPHILYYWWNMLAMQLFGPRYWAPVYLNVLLTFGIGAVFAETLRRLDFSRDYRQWALVFVLLHWEILAWSSLLNVKDILVMFLTAVSLFGFVVVLTAKRRFDYVRGLTVIGGSFFLLWWVRFYVPVFLITAAIAWLLLHGFLNRYLIPLGFLSGFLYPLVDRASWAFDKIELSNYLYGAVRFLLTPRPWGIELGYTFLLVPSLLHWLTIPLAAYGALNVIRTSRAGRFIVIYAVVAVGFFAVVPALIGPRHRLQVVLPIAWFQFHCLWYLRQRTVLLPIDEDNKENKASVSLS